MTSLIKMSKVDFFTQMTQFSAILPGRPCCSFCALKAALKCVKIGLFAALPLFQGFKTCCSCCSTTKMWGEVMQCRSETSPTSLNGYRTAKNASFQKPRLGPVLKAFWRQKEPFSMEKASKYRQNSLPACLKWAKNAFFGIPNL